MLIDLDTRVRAVTKVAERFNQKPLVLGSDDCVHMISYGLHEMNIKAGLLKYGSYKTEAGARRALRNAGFGNLIDAVGGQGFFEIEPATAWPGDILALRAEEGDEPGLAFAASGGRAFGFWNGCAQYFQPLEFMTAWRVA